MERRNTNAEFLSLHQAHKAKWKFDAACFALQVKKMLCNGMLIPKSDKIAVILSDLLQTYIE